MAISLKKGQGVNLKKSDTESNITIGLGWDVAPPKETGFLGKLFGGQPPEEYDLDVVAFLLNEKGKVADNGDVIFYNSMQHKSGAIWLTGDNRTGDAEGDDEQIIVNLDKLPNIYKKILFVVQIYEGAKKNQDFGKVRNAFIRAVDKNGKELARFDLSGDSMYADSRSLVFAELERGVPEWKFNAIGKPCPGDSFVQILRDYIDK